MERERVEELLYQSFEAERGGVLVYEKAVDCAENEELRKEWSEYLDQTRRHERVMAGVLETFGLSTETETPGRLIVRNKLRGLVGAMDEALRADADTAQLVAGESVVEAETKHHMNWELMGEAVGRLSGDEKKVLQAAYDEVEEEEDQHLYHTMGWTRELWLESLGLPAVLPPPEERKHTKTAIGAERAKQQRDEMT